ncbi:hypothetical protein EYF80_005381 [Liparis tanakae]|uniref:Uncharacterized protein n=1 Tax=Liparis tanakae TaxID=230148 RepID=A0A4Z2J3X4_9TELE|nr:hypothetical protein EYF80_005381 [Liparis tanakae]
MFRESLSIRSRRRHSASAMVVWAPLLFSQCAGSRLSCSLVSCADQIKDPSYPGQPCNVRVFSLSSSISLGIFSLFSCSTSLCRCGWIDSRDLSQRVAVASALFVLVAQHGHKQVPDQLSHQMSHIRRSGVFASLLLLACLQQHPGDGLFDLLIVVRIFLARGKVLERFREDLALAVPGPPHSLIQLEYRAGTPLLGPVSMTANIQVVLGSEERERSWASPPNEASTIVRTRCYSRSANDCSATSFLKTTSGKRRRSNNNKKKKLSTNDSHKEKSERTSAAHTHSNQNAPRGKESTSQPQIAI